jgi:hypothetical protein
MKRFVQAAVVAAAVVAMGMAGPVARAGTFDNVNVQYWAGSGSNQTVVVVDFAPGNTYAFGYRWDGNATGWDALAAVDAAGTLDVSSDLSWWNKYQSHWVTDLAYPGGVEGSGSTWGYYLSSDGNTWNESMLGVDGEALVDGGFQGWSWCDYDYYTWAHLRAPTTPFVDASPEPATLTVLLVAGAGLAARRRRRAA